ncbi:protealysin inhibitor emfourin [Billgrantia sp. LNSP4103-1]|uniref:protealysin inhibitor emfourin n=1 Tax=Billgrantia sp. LNSP4103-1 TaxID=3410266 RepID=UPI00403FA917
MRQPPRLTEESVIRLRREGGLAHFPGLARPRCIHCDRYSEAQRDELWRLMSHVESLGGDSRAFGADRRRFHLSVEDASGTPVWTQEIAEEAAPRWLLECWRRAEPEGENGGVP